VNDGSSGGDGGLGGEPRATRMGWAASEGDENGGAGDENDAGNPAFAIF